MTDEQWDDLVAVLAGRELKTTPVGFIVDCPWLPRWHGVTISEYLSSENVWFEANRKVVERFPGVWFLPGFWSEFGMCTEPSAFGARCIFPPDEFPFAERTIHSLDDIERMSVPEPSTDGLLPLVLNRLKWARPRMEDLGHRIRFAVARGPLNVASFLMGTTEFLMTLKTEPGAAQRLLRVVTDFLKRWLDLQRETFPSIEGILLLDDVVGFVGRGDFVEFALPYLRELYDADVPAKFFHNDAPCASSVGYYAGIGINLYNPGTQTPLAELRALSGNAVTILGTVPPRDVLARGTPEEVRAAVRSLLAAGIDRSRLILSCAGGMPPGVSTENLEAFILECGAGAPAG
jgi:uroporphyrinogen-III decarboxylase